MAKSVDDILQELKPENLKPLYFLHGQETYYPNAIARKLTQIAIPEHEKSFNEFIMFGKDLSIGAILNTARRFPMMADRQLVVVKDADQIQDIEDKQAQAMLQTYAEKPLSSTVLVLVFGKAMDERKTFVKAFAEKGLLLNSKKNYDSQIPEFIAKICRQKNRKISPKAVQLLFEHIGNNLESIVNEVDKVLLNVPEDGEINAETIEKFVGISKDHNVFELQKALVKRDGLRCFQIVNYFAANSKNNPIQPVILILYNFFSKVMLVHVCKEKNDAEMAAILSVNTFFLKDYRQAARVFSLGKLMQIIHELRNADKLSKGIDTGTKAEADIYKELVFSILN